MYETGTGAGDQFATIGILSEDSPLIQMLMAPDIVPGVGPSYELCKTIYSYHPLGAKLAEKPITLAQAKPREISIPVLGEKRIVAQFVKTWDAISGAKLGATEVIHNLHTQKRIYGIASVLVGERGKTPESVFNLDRVPAADLFFNIADPLNTAGSLVLNQNPNDPDYLKQGTIVVNSQVWNPSRTLAVMNEQPLFIEWSSSAFGFVGRSIYQRALFPLKTFVQTMVTDQMVTQKAGLLVANMESPGSFLDKLAGAMAGWKRRQIKSGVTNQVLQIGVNEKLETLNMMNLDKAAGFARDNVIKNIASAAGMPATMLLEESLVEGLAEGTEDFKKEVQYLDNVRQELQPTYDFMDRIVQRKAWDREFYAALKRDYPSLPSFEVWFHETRMAFEATWPNLMVEPESEKAKLEDVKFKSAVALLETMGPMLDPVNRAKLLIFVAENANEAENLFSSKLQLDEQALIDHLEKANEALMQPPEQGETAEPRPPKPFALSA